MTVIPAPLIELLDDAAVMTPAAQVWLTFGDNAVVTPLGNVCENNKKVELLPLSELSIVYVSVLTAPGVIELGEKAILNPGRELSTVNVALAVPALPSLELSAPVVFTFAPGVLLVTLRDKVQDSPLPRR
ncbi:MAG: hypothetical protein MI864_28650 [Pseudomonadales bacterium]|uniref:hypothetical protein n=1 Tax=Oleiphilus messinensis TaxID=141451 RepID=UPI0012F80ADF|nr:hypothetical protein [Oleiphilus messinensis]MCG8614502.1 hypothetical protein [Pseudomonadales bacterium]